MSSYKVIAEVSKALREILWQAFDADEVIRPLVGSKEAIVFQNPTETARDSARRLSLWLYHITENEFVKNQPMQPPANGRGPNQFPPLVLNLFYLVTPFANSSESDHLLLGKSMEALYDNAIISVRNSDPALQDNPEEAIAEELRVIFCRLTLEELTRIWEALREPYRLSICYEIRVTRIDSRRQSAAASIREQKSKFSDRASGLTG